MKHKTLFDDSAGLNHLLGLVIDGHLSGVQNHSSGDIGTQTLIKATVALDFNNLMEGLEEARSVTSLLIGHHSGLQDIEGVTNNRTDGTSGSTSTEFSPEGSILLSSAKQIFHGLVKTKSEGSIRALSQPSSLDTLVESAQTFVSSDSLDGPKNASVSLGLSSGFTDNLESGFNDVNRMDEGNSSNSGKTSTKDLFSNGIVRIVAHFF
mmetsp:Transcript_36011/g.32387  ORF Transcript_36011/g.32387 Transcript_36011/m.32387 type:complete len:208 (+) Transcript_36011:239-862(+)